MQNRREFLKKVGLVGAVAASSAVVANANENLKIRKELKRPRCFIKEAKIGNFTTNKQNKI